MTVPPNTASRGDSFSLPVNAGTKRRLKRRQNGMRVKGHVSYWYFSVKLLSFE